MKVKKTNYLLAFILIFSLGFKIGDDIELTAFLNGRTHPNFIDRAYIKKTLKAGTTGNIKEVKNFNSGNFGIKMEINDGPNNGETYWVYYNTKAPALKVFNKRNKEIAPETIDNEKINKDKPSAEVIEDTPGTRDPEEQSLIESIKVPDEMKEEIEKIGEIDADCPPIDYSTQKPELPKEIKPDLNKIRNEMAEEISNQLKNEIEFNKNELKNPKIQIDQINFQKPKMPEVKPEIKIEPKPEVKPEIKVEPKPEIKPDSKIEFQTPQEQAPEIETKLTKILEENYHPSDLTAPFRERPRMGVKSYPRCRSANSPYITCSMNNRPVKISLANTGPNQIVTEAAYSIKRTFDFEFEDRARSEIKLMIADQNGSATTYNLMMFFPRNVLPSVKEAGEELHVTLPNEEVVIFNKETKEIIGGVLTEGKMEVNKNQTIKPANINYTGNGVIIRAHNSGDLPYGDVRLRNGKLVPSTTTAVISKKGHRDCKVPSKDLWVHDKNLDNFVIKEEYASDEGFDRFIKRKCGFSIY